MKAQQKNWRAVCVPAGEPGLGAPGRGPRDPFRAEGAPLMALSPRELEILRLSALGQTTKEIAASMGIRERTVKWHVTNILQKLGAASRTAAVAAAIERGELALGRR